MQSPQMLEIDEAFAETVESIPLSAFRHLIEASKQLTGDILWTRGSHCPPYYFIDGKAYVNSTMTLDQRREYNRIFDERWRQKIAEGKPRSQVALETAREMAELARKPGF